MHGISAHVLKDELLMRESLNLLENLTTTNSTGSLLHGGIGGTIGFHISPF